MKTSRLALVDWDIDRAGTAVTDSRIYWLVFHRAGSELFAVPGGRTVMAGHSASFSPAGCNLDNRWPGYAASGALYIWRDH